MALTTQGIPPVSKAFFDQLVKTFPPLDVMGINSNTSLIDIQRKAAEQAVIEWIKRAVKAEELIINPKRTTLLQQIGALFSK